MSVTEGLRPVHTDVRTIRVCLRDCHPDRKGAFGIRHGANAINETKSKDSFAGRKNFFNYHTGTI